MGIMENGRLIFNLFLQALPGLRRNIECFYLDCRSWAKVTGVELLGTMLYQGHLLRWPVMLRNISSGKAMCLGGKDGPAYSILFKMMFVPLFANTLCIKYVFPLPYITSSLFLWNPLIFLDFLVFSYLILQAADTSMVPQDFMSANPLQTETEGNHPLPAPPPLDEECESMDSTNSNDGESASIPLLKPDSNPLPSSYPVVYPAYYSPFFPFPLPYWSGYSPEPAPKNETHEVVKPTAVHSKAPINVDELVGMSKLSLGETIGDAGPSTLSRKLLEEGPSRQSAFHATPACGTVL